ncbi:hypothetical protein [Roseicitreum antarcticum]|uniref:Antifreeze glycopeptide polyprotein n=1 Tax=Roseicitreum antarcticum TaxID=564137 RepID=A0A1H3BJS0_9RHOB|nr:hypothetical protein [Roseicitreum antarcticum]SDX41584.1 hypothetical protein SAMN04488238_10862 [Roseicitreum antarcticum]
MCSDTYPKERAHLRSAGVDDSACLGGMLPGRLKLSASHLPNLRFTPTALTSVLALALSVGAVGAQQDQPLDARRPEARPQSQSLGEAQARSQTPAPGNAPMSAIDWLSQSVALPQPQAQPFDQQLSGVRNDAISVTPLDAQSVDATGLLSARRAGLPDDFWGDTTAPALAAIIAGLSPDMLPAARDMTVRILLAELTPPRPAPQGAGTNGGDPNAPNALFLARLDKLLEFGALEQVMALTDAAGSESPAVFQRWFDAALLLGEEDRACDALRARPQLSPTLPTRVFCLARGGEWGTAALILRSAQALDQIAPADATLLIRFLDPEAESADGTLPPLSRPSPLTWRMLEAIGEPVSTHLLPIAFSHADLRGTAGWRAQLEAGERLTRAGALEPNRLLGLYSERMPAASGGIWDRVRDIQRFDTALASGDPASVAAALLRVWPRITSGELETAFSALYAAPLARLPLTGEAAALAFEIGLLTPEYETFALAAGFSQDDATGGTPGMAEGRSRRTGTDDRPETLVSAVSGDTSGTPSIRAPGTPSIRAPGTPSIRVPDTPSIRVPDTTRARFLAGVARGMIPPDLSYGNGLGRAIADAFADPAPVAPAQQRALENGALGAEVLRALDRLTIGAADDLRAVVEALALLRYVRMEDTARQAALQLLLLERRG